MKHIKEKFELDEDDIKAAIKYWIKTGNYGVKEGDFDITFSIKVENHSPPPGALVGGQSDYSVQVVQAVASKL